MKTIPSSRSATPIPTPSSSHTHADFDDDLSHFVGSPDQLPRLSTVRSHLSPSSLGSSQFQSRPSFRRTLSTSTQRRTDNISRVQELASSFARSPRPQVSPNDLSDRDWSLFSTFIADRPASNLSASRPPTDNLQTLFPSPRSVTDNANNYFEGLPPSRGIHESDGVHCAALPPSQHHEQSLPDCASAQDHRTSVNGSLSSSSARPPSSRWKCFSWPRIPTLSPVHRNILKCCVAYFIGSLFTFIPYLSAFIADITTDGPGERIPSPSGHMVATM